MYCRISLKPVKGRSKYECYVDSEFRKLFDGLKTNPVLPFSRQEFFVKGALKSTGMSISGLQQKLSLKINSLNELEVTPTQGMYILKPSPEAFPNASENEHCAMLTSRLSGIETAHCGLVSFPNGEFSYITRRFDRHNANEKTHQEDLAQGFGIKSEEKYSQSYETCGNLIHTMTNGKAAVVLDFFRRVIHAFVIGNDDMHLKNISLQRFLGNTEAFYDCLTPNYDCLFTQAFDAVSKLDVLALDLLEQEKEGLFSMAYEKYGFYTGHDFKLLGKRLGLREKPVSNCIAAFIKNKPRLIDLIMRSYMPEDMKSKCIATVSERLKAISLDFKQT